MSRSTISTFKLFEIFPDEETARQYLEGRLWPNGPVCPDCKSPRITTRARPGFYHCNACNFDFTVRTGTVFERSKVPLHKWVYAMYLLVTARKGISSMQLAKEIGVTQKTAWFMLGRLREACSAPDSIDKLKGVIEIDEAFFGGKEANKHEHKKLGMPRGVGKQCISMAHAITCFAIYCPNGVRRREKNNNQCTLEHPESSMAKPNTARTGRYRKDGTQLQTARKREGYQAA